ncbi:MAG: thioesterase, partial [Clostridia bacterium]|nr:thioesterase [Clostridia bacterium]
MGLKVGLKGSAEEVVTPDNTAIKYGSGSVDVYGTPAMIGLMEKAALSSVDPLLPSGMATVGMRMDVKHLAPTPIGLKVIATSELISVDGRKLTFRVEA